MNRMRRFVPAIGMCLVAGGIAQADDFAPPWYRGQPMSTRAAWEFAQPPVNFFDIAPDSFDAVAGPTQYPLYGGFTAHAEVDLRGNWEWTPGDGNGGLMLTPGTNSASIGFKIPNFVDDLEKKLIRIQITYQGFAPIVSGVTGWIGTGGVTQPVPGQQVGTQHVSMIHYYEDWVIYPNPNWELISISMQQGTVLDEVVIDTISLPTPGCASLIAAGGVVALGRRRR